MDHETYNPNLRVNLNIDRSTKNPDTTVASAARGDHMGDSLIDKEYDDIMDGTDKDTQGFLNELIRRGHFGPLEHSQAFFEVEGLSYYAHCYLVRHRHMSFDVASQRYVEVTDMEVVIPPAIRDDPELAKKYKIAAEQSFGAYQDAVANGVSKGQARTILPQGVCINLSFSANLRSLFHFLDLRDNGKSHNEAIQLAKNIRQEIRSWAPMSLKAYEEYTNNNSLRAP